MLLPKALEVFGEQTRNPSTTSWQDFSNDPQFKNLLLLHTVLPDLATSSKFGYF